MSAFSHMSSLASLPIEVINACFDFGNVSYCYGNSKRIIELKLPDGIHTNGENASLNLMYTFYKSKFYVAPYFTNIIYVCDRHGELEKSLKIRNLGVLSISIIQDEIFIAYFNGFEIDVFDLDGNLKRVLEAIDAGFITTFSPYNDVFLCVQCNFGNRQPYTKKMLDGFGKQLQLKGTIHDRNDDYSRVLYVDPKNNRVIVNDFGAVMMFVDNSRIILYQPFFTNCRCKIFMSPLDEIYFVSDPKCDEQEFTTIYICNPERIPNRPICENTHVNLHADRTITLNFKFNDFLHLIFLEDGSICCFCTNNMCYFLE